MNPTDTQYTADELAIMNGQELPDTAPPVETPTTPTPATP